jgi:hypothetical protein
MSFEEKSGTVADNVLLGAWGFRGLKLPFLTQKIVGGIEKNIEIPN